MPLPVLPDFFLASARFENTGGEISMNTFCFRNESSFPEGDTVAEQIRDVLDSFYGDRSDTGSNVGRYLAGSLHSLSYVIYDLGDPDGGGYELASEVFPTTAVASPPIAPPDLAVCLSWTTAKRGRSFRGRTFVGPLSDLALDATGRVPDAVRTTLSAAGSKLIGQAGTRAVSLHVLSRTKGLATPVTGGYVDNAYDVQRRRDIGSTARTPIVAP
jgi:hypothetical protein